jgi:hypothetical protein
MAGKIKTLSFSEGVSVSDADDLLLEVSRLPQFANDAAFVTAKGSAAETGDFYFNTGSSSMRIYNGVSWSNIGTTFATETDSGTVSAAAQNFGGIKRFYGGLASYEYVGTNPEVGGSSPFQLAVGHKRVQVLNPAGAITVRLPSAGNIKQGDSWTIVNRSDNTITIQDSAGSAIRTMTRGYCTFRALADDPLAANWFLERANGYGENAPGYTNITGSGAYIDVASVTLPGAGVYYIEAGFTVEQNGATLSGSPAIEMGVTSDAGNTGANLTYGDNYLIQDVTTSFGRHLMNLPRLKVRSDGTNVYYAGNTGTGTQTLYLKVALAPITANTPRAIGKLSWHLVGN